MRKSDHHYTYAEYRRWPEDDRWELIDGVAYAMASPAADHQAVSMELGASLHNFLKGKPCRVFAAPFDVLFPLLTDQNEDEVDTVVQPDLLVACDPARIRPHGHWGAPELVVEILSPSTASRDIRIKFALYQRAGVKEYWLIDPAGRWVQQYILGPDGKYLPEVLLIQKGVLVCTVLPGFEVDIGALWPEGS